MTAWFENKARPVAQLPRWIKTGLLLALLCQFGWHFYQPAATARIRPLPAPMSAQTYRLISLDEPIATAKYLNLWLQSFDTQPGISLSFQQLDYHRIILWLDTILKLDPKGQYPLLVAAHIYGSIHNHRKQRMMMDYIFRKFQQHPGAYWRWLAHAVIIAKHELKDNALALKYANALASASASKATHVPYWARDLKIILLEDMGELEAARIIVGGLISHGDIHDRYEVKFLVQKLKTLQQKLKVRHKVENSTQK